jgi:hypothetical protein
VKSSSGDDAPAGRVCAVGSTTACSGDNLITCDADGNQASSEVCTLGCNSSGTPACKLVAPSNGLSAELDDSALAPDLTLMGVTTIDTDAGTITDQSGARTPPTTTVSGGPVGVFVIEAKSFTSSDHVTVTGTRALAIVSFGAVQIGSLVAVDATGFGVDGSGAVVGDATCAGSSAGAGNSHGEGGGGGGGFGTKGGIGGSGGAPTVAGGAGGNTTGTIELVPLRGGCRGGRPSNQFNNYNSGGGGGAVQIVSNTSIAIADHAFISANGGGGQGPAGPIACIVNTPCGDGEGGGSGGGILLEAPAITVSALGGVVANGGGGTCNVEGSAQSGQLSATPAMAQPCGGDDGSGGNGAAGALAALNGAPGSGNNPVGGGGGGGAGRIRINLPLGTTFAPAGTISPTPSVGTLATR